MVQAQSLLLTQQKQSLQQKQSRKDASLYPTSRDEVHCDAGTMQKLLASGAKFPSSKRTKRATGATGILHDRMGGTTMAVVSKQGHRLG